VRPSVVAGACAAAAVLTVAACGGSGERPLRIALVNPCHGQCASSYEAYIGALELPLIERGARLAGKRPSAGLVGAEAAGHPVELLFGCGSEGGDPAAAPVDLLEIRRVVEREQADVVVLDVGESMPLAVRDYARRHPSVAFMTSIIAYQSTTLDNPTPNLFALFPDYATATAGLGVYAYNTLGWRTAVTIDADSPLGWDGTAGFVAAFCALGGRVVNRVWVPFAYGTGDAKAAAAKAPKHGVDGIYVGGGDISSLRELGRTLPLLRGNVGRKIVVQWYGFLADQEAIAEFGARLDGLAFNPGPFNQSSRASARYFEQYNKTFPGQPGFYALGGQDLYGITQAVLRAYELADGDLSDGERRFRAALAKTDIHAPNGHFRLDERRAAIGPSYVITTKWAGKKKGLVSNATLTYPDVDQTFGGYLAPGGPPPSRTSPPCKKLADPPAWMRLKLGD
jgi:branched-chain amino acid transport system substrate-binding protein